MKTSLKYISLLLILLAIGLGIFYWYYGNPKSPTPALKVIDQPTSSQPPKAVTHYPIGSDQSKNNSAEDLPSLLESDTAMRKSLAGLVGDKKLSQLIFPKEIIRRIVVSIDNLPRETVSAQLLPLNPVAGQFAVTANGQSMTIAPDNYRRYEPYVELIQDLDTSKLVGIYKYFYPLFQQQYKELGYPDGYFNDRLVEVMDYMINFKEVTEPVQLTQTHVLYQYADPDLEKMSAGGKLLTRIGPANASKVKDKLREIRSELVRKER